MENLSGDAVKPLKENKEKSLTSLNQERPLISFPDLNYSEYVNQPVKITTYCMSKYVVFLVTHKTLLRCGKQVMKQVTTWPKRHFSTL